MILEQHECNIVKDFTQMDVCKIKFSVIEDAIERIENGVNGLRNMIWGQFSVIGIALLGYVLSQIK